MYFRDEYAFLSNFHPCKVEREGIAYPSVEHAYQAEKLPLDERHKILALTAGQAKRYVRNYALPEDWHKHKNRIMFELLFQKFQHQELMLKLSAIKQPIVEDNYWNDTYWGKCNGVGKNILGKMLEMIKHGIRPPSKLDGGFQCDQCIFQGNRDRCLDECLSTFGSWGKGEPYDPSEDDLSE